MARITARLWKRRRTGPWTPATVAELRQLTNKHTRPQGWTLTPDDAAILVRRMQDHSPHHDAGAWSFFWGDPQLTLFERNAAADLEIAPLARMIPGGRTRTRAAAGADLARFDQIREEEAEQTT